MSSFCKAFIEGWRDSFKDEMTIAVARGERRDKALVFPW